ncbi:MAG: GNAT family N-acetyltransferase [Betaproteobacteria bacterium]|nr:GNAT family N-acetyltransferase [Betaproteobacteria bacterium]
MLHTAHHEIVHAGRRLSVGLAERADEILAAQRLRYRVFAEELGARLPTRTAGVDQDLYDPFCEHLVVRDEDAGRVVGTYRILSPEAARRAGSYYSEGEFDLTRLQLLRTRVVEVGRSCIDADYRSGAVISLLWSGLARYMVGNAYDYLIGCASIGMADGGHNAAGIHARLGGHLAPPEYRVFPRCPLPLDKLEAAARPEIPPLLKGYLRAGAWVCGDPAWDPDFNTADLLLLLPMARVQARYARHFVERQA